MLTLYRAALRHGLTPADALGWAWSRKGHHHTTALRGME